MMRLVKLIVVLIVALSAHIGLSAPGVAVPMPPVATASSATMDWSARYQTLIVGILTFLVGGSVGLHTITSARFERNQIKEEKRLKQLTYSVVLEQELNAFKERLTASRETVELIRSGNEYSPEVSRAVHQSTFLEIPKAITDDWDRLTFLDTPMLRNLQQFMGLYADSQRVLKSLSRIKGVGAVRSLFPEDEASEEDRLASTLEDLSELYGSLLQSIDSLLVKLTLRIGELGG